jgi:hypothetical protein
MVQSFVLAREPSFAVRPREPRSGPWRAPSIAVPFNARDIEARDIERGGACTMRGPESFVLAAGSVIMRFARHRTCQSEAPTTGADMTPQFRSGQTVRLSRGLPYKSAADGDYKIVRQLPDNGGEQQYRIKSVREPHERVVKESDLEKV